MRVLLDECLPRKLQRDLAGHDARTVPEMGWASKENGDLLGLAAGHFDVFLTVDLNLSYQQDMRRFNISVVVLVARGNRLADLGPLMPQVLEVFAEIRPGQLLRVGS